MRRKIKTVMEQMNAEKPDDVLADLERKHGCAAPPLLCASHDFKEEYYGWRCVRCGQFHPNTCPLENWLTNEPYDPDGY